jgi:signal transduction histidine kinase
MSNQHLQVIAVINAQLAILTDEASLLETGRELIRNYFELSMVKIYRLDLDQQALVAQNRHIPLSDTQELVVQCLQAAEPMLNQDALQIAIPLYGGGRFLGAMDVYGQARSPLGYDDLLALTIVANQLSSSWAQVSQKGDFERMRSVAQFHTAFLDNIMHDLRTPLGTVTGWSKVIMGGMDGEINVEVAQHTEMIFNAGMQLREMLDDMSLAMKAEAGQLALDLQALDLAPVLEQLLKEIGEKLNKPYLSLKLNIHGRPSMMLADHHYLNRAIHHLVMNCVRYTDQGQILLSFWEEGGLLHLLIQDQDHKVDVSKLSNFFDWNWRGKGKHSFHPRGAAFNFGLVMVQKVVALHRASLGVYGESGQGLSFYLSFAPHVTESVRTVGELLATE